MARAFPGHLLIIALGVMAAASILIIVTLPVTPPVQETLLGDVTKDQFQQCVQTNTPRDCILLLSSAYADPPAGIPNPPAGGADQTCGNGVREGTEECDSTSNGACPASCSAACRINHCSQFKSCNSIPRAFCSNDGAPGATPISEYDGKQVTCGACTISPCPPGGAAGSCWQCPASLPKYDGMGSCVEQDARVTPPCERTSGQRCYIGVFDPATMRSIAATNGGGCSWNVNGINPHSGSFMFLTLGCAACKDGYHWEPASWSPRYDHPEDYYVGGEEPAMGCVPD